MFVQKRSSLILSASIRRGVEEAAEVSDMIAFQGAP